MCRVNYSLCLYLEHCIVGVNIFPETFVVFDVDAGVEITVGVTEVGCVGHDIVGAALVASLVAALVAGELVLLAANPK